MIDSRILRSFAALHPSGVPPAQDDATTKTRVHLDLLAVGFVTLLAQVVLLREVLVASFGSELIYLLAMGVQMLGTAIGALVARRITETRLRALFLVFAAAVPLLVALARSTRLIFHGTPGAYLPFAQQLAGIALVLLPAGIAGGMLFTNAARLYAGSSGTLARAYAIESVGGLLGGAVSTLLIAAGVQNFAAGVGCGIVAGIAGLGGRRISGTSGTTGTYGTYGKSESDLQGSGSTIPSGPSGPILRTLGALLLLLLTTTLAFSTRFDRALTALTHPKLLATRDTPYGRATITGDLGQIAVFENDALAYESQGTSAEEFVHLAALQCERPRSVLLLGGSVEGLAEEVWKHGPAAVRQVEVDRRLLELAQPFLPQASRGSRITFEEPRHFLERTGSYDLILSAMPDPDSGQASRFYTREFFDLCARKLTRGGVLAFRLRSSENLWTPALAQRTASIVEALRSSFLDVLVLPGTVNTVIASNAPLVRDPEVLVRRFREREIIGARLVSPAYLRYMLTNDRVAEIRDLLARTAAPASSDARPVCYQYTLVLWLSKFFPTIALTDVQQLSPGASRAAAGAWIAAAGLLAAAALAARRSQKLRRTLLIAFAGFAGVVLEGALILGYQISRGVLYEDLGILLTMFMAGLAAGSWMIGRRRDALPRSTGLLLLAGTVAVALVTAWSISSPARGLASSAFFLFAAGFVTGAIFAFATLRGDSSIGALYAADLAGGVAGSIAGSLFLIPLLGMAGSVLVIGVLALMALLLV